MYIYDTSDTARFLADLRQVRARMEGHERNLATGRRLHRPGDDASQVSHALRLRELRAEASAFRGRQDQVRSRLDATEDALTRLDELVTRAREAAMQAQSPSGGGQSAQALAETIDGLHAEALGIGNTRFADTYLFGGTRFGGRDPTPPEPAAPFTQDVSGAVTYNGNAEVIEVEVFPQSSVAVNLPGSDVFQGGQDLFVTLQDLSAAIRSGDGAGIDQALTRLQAVEEQVHQAVGRLGARLSRLDGLQADTDALELQLAGASDDVEGADLVADASALTQDNVLLQAALAARGRKVTLSLFDFLG
jgi:flagellar hook-associated protein 3 FlgL